MIERVGIDEVLRGRTRIDVAEYERIMGLPREITTATDAAPGTFRFAGVRDDRRTYVGSAG